MAARTAPGGGGELLHPDWVAADGAGDVYVTDTGNFNIRKITAAGSVSTLALSAGR